ncbi:hypothetical protein [Brevibacterium sp. 1718]|uniref:hypothetical protein n=1 Tax=Brevibacterium sp. 1718 TaxID=3413510 RepID=UPI003DA9E158
MDKWIWSITAIAFAAFIGIVVVADNDPSVRVGAWAQFVATLGTIFAAYLAFRTADANRAQAKEANQALAEATRPQLSLNITPNTYGSGRPDPMTPLTLTISNRSKFNVNAYRVDWKLPGGTFSRKDLGAIFADANPTTGTFSDHVSYASGLSSHEQVELGLHQMYLNSVIEVVFYYSSTFSNGEWMEVHFWETRDEHDRLTDPNWRLFHTYDPPKWIPTST